MTTRYPCPCCGHLTFLEPPGSFDICPVCYREDDAIQLRWPDYEGGANGSSLREAQRLYLDTEAFQQRMRGYVRAPLPDEPLDEGWRPIDASDNFEPPGTQEATWPGDDTLLYWWRPTYWRKKPHT